jgi:MFS transporter, DHA3 family, macrolide efflux protein
VPKAAVTANYLDDMREAVTYLYHNKVLRFLMLICVLLNMIYLPMVMLVMPYINYQVIKISGFQLSLIEAAFGTGATLGGLYLSLRKDSKKLIKQLFSLLIVQAVLLFFWIFPVLPGFEYLSKTYITAVFCLIMGISGVVNMVQNVPVYTHFQLEIPENLRGKVLGFINVSAMIALPLGMWLCGLLLEATSWHYLIILASSLLTLICLISRRNKHFVNFAASFS